MRVASAVAVVLLLLSAAAVQAANGPPVIREPWTPLPCPMHPQSTVDNEGCLERAVTASDLRINTRVATIFRLIRTASDRTAFVDGERSWLRYRRRSCAATASAYRGGSAEPLAFLSCEQSRNARHLADLADTEQVLRRR